MYIQMYMYMYVHVAFSVSPRADSSLYKLLLLCLQ